MRHLTILSVLGMLGGLLLSGCQDHSSMNTVTGPDGPNGSIAPGVATNNSPLSEFEGSGVVYTLSNDASENSILRFSGDGTFLSYDDRRIPYRRERLRERTWQSGISRPAG